LVKTELLKSKIKEKGLSVADVANEIGVNPSTLFRKFQSGGNAFTVGQVAEISTLLELTKDEVNHIFFDD